MLPSAPFLDPNARSPPPSPVVTLTVITDNNSCLNSFNRRGREQAVCPDLNRTIAIAIAHVQSPGTPQLGGGQPSKWSMGQGGSHLGPPSTQTDEEHGQAGSLGPAPSPAGLALPVNAALAAAAPALSGTSSMAPLDVWDFLMHARAHYGSRLAVVDCATGAEAARTYTYAQVAFRSAQLALALANAAGLAAPPTGRTPEV